MRLTACPSRRTGSGIYETLHYDSTLELLDPVGHTTVLHKRQQVRFLQNNIIAFQDYAWGDDEIFAEYHCSPGAAVVRNQDGDRWNILIFMRETKSRGVITDFRIERMVHNGLLEHEEWDQVEIQNPTRCLRLTVIFPKARPCHHATLL